MGAFPLVLGIVGIAAHDEGRGEARGDYRPLAALVATGGGLAVAGGITLIVWGSQEGDGPDDTVSAMPVVRIGVTSASTTWSF